MTNMRGVVAGCMAAVLATWIAACGEPQCPWGYYKENGRCYFVRDAGADAAVSDGGEGTDAEIDGEDAGPSPGPAPAEDAAVDDGGTSACDVECPEHETCVLAEGMPTCACREGYEACEDGCADLASDPSNCGSCGYACETGLSCKEGECEQKIRELVLRGDRSCAIYEAPDEAYPVKCWGDPKSMLFRDSSSETLTPRGIAGVPAVRGLALAEDFQCFVVPGRDAVRCWGNCGSACGNSGSVASSDAFFESSVPAVSRILAGGGFGTSPGATCALNGLARLSCWGTGTMNAVRTDTSTPSASTLFEFQSVLDLSIGAAHGCAVTHDGHVACWGSNTLKQLGVAVEPSPRGSSAVVVPKESGGELTGVTDVEAGPARSCAITGDGNAWCWGLGLAGALGAGDTADHVGAVNVAGLSEVESVAIGRSHTCAMTRSGQAYCWGAVPFAGLGDGVPGDTEDGVSLTRPLPVPNLDDIIEIRAGGDHTCARRRNGQVVCWGKNAAGQLGDGSAIARLSPTPVVGLY